MKIRNGFVSNSSSSSFILAYDKTKVLTDPKTIIEYIDENPRDTVVFKGWDCGEGDDIFTLSVGQKNYILDHKDRFIKWNKGTVEREEFIDDDSDKGYHAETFNVPCITAYIDPESFSYYDEEYIPDEAVDMSDVEYPEKYFEMRDSEEAKQRINEYYRILYKRERQMYRDNLEKELKERREDILSKEKVSPENLVVEKVNVSNRSCDIDSGMSEEFPYRYLGLKGKDYSEYEY